MKEIIKKVISLGITLESYSLLYILFTKNEELFKEYIKICGKVNTESIEQLVSKGYITASCGESGKYLLSQILLTPQGVNLFPSDSKVSEWISTWYELWPKGVESGGYLVKSLPGTCQKKMEKFCKDFPQYTKGIIIGATKNYISRMRGNGGYFKLAHYFISKDGVSILEGECDRFLTSVKTPDRSNLEAI